MEWSEKNAVLKIGKYQRSKLLKSERSLNMHFEHVFCQ